MCNHCGSSSFALGTCTDNKFVFNENFFSRLIADSYPGLLHSHPSWNFCQECSSVCPGLTRHLPKLMLTDTVTVEKVVKVAMELMIE